MKHLFTLSERSKDKWVSFATFATFASAIFCKLVKLVNLVLQFLKLTKLTKLTEQIFAESLKSLKSLMSFFSSRGVKDVRVSLGQQRTNIQRISNLSLTINRHFTRIAAVLALVFVLGIGNVWGTDVQVYQLTITQNSSNTAYATYYDITVGTIGWKVPGNQNLGNYVKLGGGGKNGTLSNEDRYVYSKNAISDNISKIVVNHGALDANVTVNSMTLTVYSTAANAASGSSPISTLSGTYSANGNVTFNRPDAANWSGRFYRLNYNISTSTKGNKGLILNSITFYKEGASCSNKVNLTKGSQTNGTFSLNKSNGEYDNCDANFVVTVSSISANTGYYCSGVTATGGNSEVTGPDGSGNYTVTYTKGNNITSTITANFAAKTARTVTFMNNGAQYGDIRNLYDGDAVGTLPTAPSSCKVGKVFVGWSETNIGVTPTDVAPSFISASTVVSGGNKVYYAVFATVTPGEEEVLSQTLAYDTWTYSGTTADKTSYRLFGNNSYVQSASFDLSTLSKVIVYGGTFGGDSYNSLTIGDGTNTWKSVTVSGSSQTGTNTYTDGTALSGTGALRVTSKSGNGSNNGVRISQVKIYTIPNVYSGYITECCTELAQINGSVAMSQTSAVLTWDDLGGVAALDPYAVTYRKGSDAYSSANVGEITTNAQGKKTCTINGLDCGTEYDFKIAVTGDGSHCDAEQVLEDQSTTKWNITYNLTNTVDLSEGPAQGANACGEISASFTKDELYTFPAEITVTIGGNAATADDDYLWDDSEGELYIEAAKVTGDVVITIAGVAPAVPIVTPSSVALSFAQVKKGAAIPAAQDVAITGHNLTAALTVTSSNPLLYAVSVKSGSLTPDGNKDASPVITITPQAGITDVAGDKNATITISGGGLAASVVVNVTFIVQETYTVNWYVNGSLEHTQTDVANTDYDEVPSDFSAFDDCKDGLTFIGWSETAFGSTTSAPSLANIGTKITANKDYYAVFAEGTPGSTSKLFEETFAESTGTAGWEGNAAAGTIVYDNEGWTASYASGNGGSAKFGGSSSKLGVATTPSISVTGNATLTFKSGAWISDTESTTLNLSATGATLSDETVTLVKGEWNTYSVDVEDAEGSIKITFTGGAASKGRFFLDDVVVSQTSAPVWTKYYTTCPHTYIVALSPATNGNGTISFAKNASVITEIETTGEAATVDVVAAPATGYELSGVALSGIAGASYNAGVITLPANTEGTLTATATFSKANYAVTYTTPSNGTYTIKVGDAAAVSTNTTAQHEQTITLAVASVTEGYQFIGWTVTKTVGGAAISVDGNNQFTMPAEAVTVAANFQEIPAVAYTVTFSQGDHGTCTESSLEEESAGAGVTLPSCNATTGYAFLGWTATENKTTVDEGLTAGALYRPEEDITLYAVYKQLKAVTLMKRDNSGTDVVLYEDVATGKVELPARTCKNNDYSFAGWSQTYYSTEQEDADAVIFVAGEYTPTGNITLYPVFSRSSESYVWTKITDLSTVTEGTYALVSTADYAFNGTMSSGHGQKTTTAFEFTVGVAEEAPEGTCILEFQAVTEEEVVVGYKMYNATNGYLYASAASSGKLAWQDSEGSYWKEGNGDWLYNANSAHLRVYDNTFRTYAGSSNNALAVAKKTTVLHSLYLAAPANTVAAPTFTPEAGTYYGAQNITISSETNDVTIYYTDNGSVPSNESTEFTGAFSVSSSKTIKAIAIDEDGYSSPVAEAAYTIYPVYNSIAAYQAANAQEAATAKVQINKESANAIVIGVVGSYTYVQDGTAAMVIKRPNSENPLTVGYELDGYVIGTRTTNYGLPMITVENIEGLASEAAGTPITAQTVSNLDFAGAWNSYAGNLIKVSDVYFQAQATSDRIVALTDGAEHTGAIYDALFKIDGANLPLTATACDVTGILVARTDNEVTTHYIAPTALTDISTKGAVAQLNVSPVGGADAEHAVGIAPGGQVTVTPVDGFATTLNGEEISTISTVDVTGPTSITVSASRQFYADNEQEYFYEVDNSYMPVTVNQPTNVGGSTISANPTSAQAGNTITLSYNLADHYHFNSWNVYKTGDAETTVTVTNNQFNMPAYAVTVEADIEEDAYAMVVFDGNGATGDAPAGGKKYVGQEVTMPNKGALVKADHVLASWTYNATEYAIGDTYEIQAGDAAIGGKNITFTANWTAYPWANGGDWMLVTDAAEVTAGSYVIIAAAASNVAISTTQNSNNRAQQSISKNDNILTYTTAPAIFEVRTGNIENTLAFYDVVNEGYIYAAGGGNYLRTQDDLSNQSSWNIEITNAGEATILANDVTQNSLRYNDNNSLFSCYASGQKAIALYKYYAPVPKVTYDKNTEDEVTNMPNPSVQRAEDNKATIAAGPSRTGYTFEGWKNGNTTYTVGEEYTFTEDITLYAQWEALPSFHVTYNTSGSQGTTPTDATNYYEGDEVTLASASGLSNAGYFFDQWVVTYVDGESEVQTVAVEDNKFTMPAFNVTVTATWARKSSDKWIKVTATSQLTTGKEYIIVNTDATYAIGGQNTNNRAAAAIEENNGILTISDAVAKFTLGIPEADKYTFQNGGKYLYASSNTKNYLNERAENSDDNSVWTISIDGEGAATVTASGTNSHNVMRYNPNNGSPIFSCYTSGSTTGTLVSIYYKAPKIEINDSESVNVSDAAGSDIVIHEGGVLTIDAAASIGDLTVEAGGKVTLSSNKLTVVGTFSIETAMASGNSGQLNGASVSNFEAGEAYIDITLGAGGTNQQWHAFTVPFPVDVMNGIYDLDGNKLTNEVNYAIMDYHGDIRATGAYGWKKIRTTLVPGTFYIMATDGYRTTYRFKKKAGAALVAENSKEIFKFAASGDGVSTDAGWNGVGNPTLTYGKVGVEVQVLDPGSYTFVKKDANSTNFVVGTPFFYQAAAAGSISMLEANAGASYAPRRVAANGFEKIKVAFGNEEFTDYLDVSASEEALNEYQIGKDLAKMTMTNTPKVAQIFGKAYNTKLCMVHAPMVNDQAEVALELYAPQAGTYTISVPTEREDASLYLTKDGAIIWDLTMSPYEAEFDKGQNNGYGLMLVRKAPQVTTGVENVQGDKTQCTKVILNDHVYILRDAQLYDVTGKAVK